MDLGILTKATTGKRAVRSASARLADLLSKGWVFKGRDGDVEYEIDWSAYFMPQPVLDRLSEIGGKALNSPGSDIRK